MKAFSFIEPDHVDGAIAQLEHDGDEAHLIAGGTAVVLLLKQGLIEPARLVSLARIPALAAISEEADRLVIGAMATLRQVERHPAVRSRLPAVAEAIAHVGTVRVRNQATLGGNLAHADPAQDPPPILLVHDASVITRGPGGERIIPLDELFVDVFETSLRPAEVITAVVVPRPPAGARSVYRSFLPRTVDDYPTVGVAVLVELEPDGTIARTRIALGNAGSTPLRMSVAETALTGRRPGSSLLAEAADLAAQHADPLGDMRGSASYKRDMIRVWTRRALEAVVERREQHAMPEPRH